MRKTIFSEEGRKAMIRRPRKVDKMDAIFKQRGIGPVIYRTLFLIIIIALLFEIAILFYNSYEIERENFKLKSLQGNVDNLNDTEIELLKEYVNTNEKIGQIIPEKKYEIMGRVSFYLKNNKRAFYLENYVCNQCGEIEILIGKSNSKEFIKLQKDNDKEFAFIIGNEYDLSEYNILIVRSILNKKEYGTIYLS